MHDNLYLPLNLFNFFVCKFIVKRGWTSILATYSILSWFPWLQTGSIYCSKHFSEFYQINFKEFSVSQRCPEFIFRLQIYVFCICFLYHPCIPYIIFIFFTLYTTLSYSLYFNIKRCCKALNTIYCTLYSDSTTRTKFTVTSTYWMGFFSL